MSGIIYIISAPSGSGKSTLVNGLRKFVPGLEFSISYTTRAPRGSEQNGNEYYFIDRRQFEEMIQRNEFLEYADVFGKYYGTAKSVLEQAARPGNDVILDIDVQGERQVKQKIPQAVSIFVLPPSRKELESRLRKRSRSENVYSEEVIRRRLDTARREIENYPNYDYILVNDRLDQSVDELEAIVLAERLKRSGKPLLPEQQRCVESAERNLRCNMQDKIESILASF
jgi:guanylate kinase